jgi:hypothetical protein
LSGRVRNKDFLKSKDAEKDPSTGIEFGFLAVRLDGFQ